MSTTATFTTASVDEMVVSQLNFYVRDAAKETEAFVESATKYGLAYAVEWGESAVRADHLAQYAGKVLRAVERGDLTTRQALAAYGKEVREDLLNNRLRPSSTGALHNASKLAQADAASRFVGTAEGFEGLYAEAEGE
jgi:hypothetical protein